MIGVFRLFYPYARVCAQPKNFFSAKLQKGRTTSDTLAGRNSCFWSIAVILQYNLIAQDPVQSGVQTKGREH